MSFRYPEFQFVEITKDEFLVSLIYCLFVGFLAYSFCRDIDAIWYESIVIWIIPSMLLASCWDYFLLFKTRKFCLSANGFFFFLYTYFFYLTSYPINSDNLEFVLLLVFPLLIVAYFMIPYWVIEKLNRQEGKPPIIKGFVKAALYTISDKQRSHYANLLIGLCWGGYFILGIVHALPSTAALH